MGSGKTLYTTSKAILNAQLGRGIQMNYPLSPKFNQIYPKTSKRVNFVEDMFGFLDERMKDQQERHMPMEEYRDLFVVDEAWSFVHARTAMSIANITAVDYLKISRHLGLELLMDVQFARTLDIQAKLLVQVWIIAEKILAKDGFWFQYEYHDMNSGRVTTTYMSPQVAAQFYPYYSTTEILPPLELSGLRGGSKKSGDGPTKKQWNIYKENVAEELQRFRKELNQVKELLKKQKPVPVIKVEGRKGRKKT